MAAVTLTLFYENEYFRIRYNKEFSVVELSFLQHPDAAHFRHGYDLAFDAASHKAAAYWLTDATHIKAMERENQLWLMEKMTPFLKSGRIKRFAIVMAPECFVMTSPNQMYEKPIDRPETPSVSPIKVHFNKEAAYHWLLSTNEIIILDPAE